MLDLSVRNTMANIHNDRPTYLSNVLTNYRKVNKLSQEDVARHLGITRSAYAYYELGRTEPSNENLRILAKLYSAPIEDFFPPDKNSSMNFSDNSTDMFENSAIPARMGALSDDERKLIALFRVADLPQKRKIIEDIQAALQEKK